VSAGEEDQERKHAFPSVILLCAAWNASVLIGVRIQNSLSPEKPRQGPPEGSDIHMLIVNADDYGLNRSNTDNIAHCFRRGSISSATIMVFREDSRRAAEIARELGIPVGLHLNISLPCDTGNMDAGLLHHQDRLVRHFSGSRLARHGHSPHIRNSLHYSLHAQLDEYRSLFNGEPTHIDGHHFLHQCTTMIVGGIIPGGTRVRPKLTEWPYRNPAKALFGLAANRVLHSRFTMPRRTYDLDAARPGILDLARKAVSESRVCDIELMVHIEKEEERDFLLCDEYLEIIDEAEMGSYQGLE
jgi:predicted glycoside hydrolase/deacetylase ChbG (UPF0249 family)